MKNQAYRMAMLYDFYGDLLTDRQRNSTTSIIMRTSPWPRSPRTTASPARAFGT